MYWLEFLMFILLVVIVLPTFLILVINILSISLLGTLKIIPSLDRVSARISIKVLRKIALAFTLILSSYFIVCLIFGLITNNDPFLSKNFLVTMSWTTVLAFILYTLVTIIMKSKFNFLYYKIENVGFGIISRIMNAVLWIFSTLSKKETAVTRITSEKLLIDQKRNNVEKKHFFSTLFEDEKNEIKYSVVILDSLVLLMTVISLLLLSELNPNENSEDSIRYYTFLFLSIIIAKIHANHLSE